MSETPRGLAEEMVRRVQANQKTINGIEHGVVVFRIYRGQLVQMSATTNLNLAAGELLCPVRLTDEPPE